MGYVHQKCCEMLRLDIWWFEFFGTCLLPYLLNRESYLTINRIKRINYESLFHSSSSLWSNKTLWSREFVFCKLSEILKLMFEQIYGNHLKMINFLNKKDFLGD